MNLKSQAVDAQMMPLNGFGSKNAEKDSCYDLVLTGEIVAITTHFGESLQGMALMMSDG